LDLGGDVVEGTLVNVSTAVAVFGDKFGTIGILVVNVEQKNRLMSG